MDDYKSNSNKSKEESTQFSREKKVEKVISGKVKSKKKNTIMKFADIFIPEDVDDIKSYIFMDVLVPIIKNAISDIGHSCIDTIFPGATKYMKNNSTASKISYRSYYEKENDRKRDYDSSKIKNSYSYDDITLDNRGEAEDVLSRMDELVSTYGLVSVADLYDLVGITGNYTDYKYGWTDIRSSSVIRVRGGYMLKLPKAFPLN